MSNTHEPLDWDPKTRFEDLTPEQEAELMEHVAPEILERGNSPRHHFHPMEEAMPEE